VISLFVPVAVPLMAGPRRSLPACICTHPYDQHSHLRAGSDCGLCGSRICEVYRASGWRAWVRAVATLMWAPGTGVEGDFAPAVIETSHELGELGDVTWLDRQSRDEDDGPPPVGWTWLHGGEK
jgi:hypothetical protein